MQAELLRWKPNHSVVRNNPPKVYQEPLTRGDLSILSSSVQTLVSSVQSGALKPTELLVSFGKRALQAHAETNCLTEILVSSAEQQAQTCNRKGPLAGVPVSLKDGVSVSGYDSSIGYSAFTGSPMEKDSPLT